MPNVLLKKWFSLSICVCVIFSPEPAFVAYIKMNKQINTAVVAANHTTNEINIELYTHYQYCAVNYFSPNPSWGCDCKRIIPEVLIRIFLPSLSI